MLVLARLPLASQLAMALQWRSRQHRGATAGEHLHHPFNPWVRGPLTQGHPFSSTPSAIEERQGERRMDGHGYGKDAGGVK